MFCKCESKMLFVVVKTQILDLLLLAFWLSVLAFVSRLCFDGPNCVSLIFLHCEFLFPNEAAATQVKQRRRQAQLSVLSTEQTCFLVQK